MEKERFVSEAITTTWTLACTGYRGAVPCVNSVAPVSFHECLNKPWLFVSLFVLHTVNFLVFSFLHSFLASYFILF